MLGDAKQRCIARRPHGLSIIELLIVLVVVGVLLGAGSIGFGAAQNSGIATETANALLSDLQFARSEAIKRNQPVRVCPARLANDGTTENLCAGNWDSVPAVLVLNENDELLRAPTVIRDRVEFVQIPFENPLEFRPAGSVDGVINSDELLVLQVTERQVRCIEILRSGRSRVIPRSDTNACS